MKRLLVAAALAPLSFAASAHAQTTTTISTATTTPITTSAKGSITISSAGSIIPTTTNTAAVTIDSSNAVVINSGTIEYSGVNNVVGVKALGGDSGTITNTGTIELIETTNYKDTNSDGIADSNGSVLGQYASGTGRYGIQVTGAGVFTGSIVNSGTISVIGSDSAAIEIDTGGLLGNLTTSGTISATGGNTSDTTLTYGIHSLGAITGNVSLSGAISATGKGATAVELDGDVKAVPNTTGPGTVAGTGSVDVRGTITATGYRSTSAPTDPTLLSRVANQASSELLQGGSALVIAGSVDGGITLDAAVTSSGTTTAQAAAVITSDGRAPAVLVGGTTATNIGPSATTVNGKTYDFILAGSVYGFGLYSTDANGNPVGANGLFIGAETGWVTVNSQGQLVDSTGAAIAATNTHTVTMNDGLAISGVLEADSIFRSAVSSGVTGNATALYIGDATLGKIDVSGTVLAIAASKTSVSANAIDFGGNANVASLNNTGVIEASITGIAGVVGDPAGGGTTGYATAIRDRSGTLTSVTNTNTIKAVITPENATDTVNASASRTIAIDMSQAKATTTTTVTQSAFIQPSTSTSTSITPSITGDVLFGAGNGVLNLQTGTLTGAMIFGGGSDNQINITGGAVAKGALAEKAGGLLAIEVSIGTLDITSPTAVANYTTGGSATIGTAGTIGISTLHVAGAGELILTVDPTADTTKAQLNASGAVTFDTGSKLGLNFTSKLTTSETITLITAGAGQISLGGITELGSVPWIYTGTVAANSNNSAVTVQVGFKDAKTIGLNPAETAAYNAWYAAFDKTDTKGIGSISDAVLAVTDQATFLHLYDQFLPDYSGGPFETLLLGQQSLARAEADSPGKLQTDENRGWVQEIGFVNDRSNSSSINGYEGKGFGFAGGFERASGKNAMGVAAAFIAATVNDSGRPDGSNQSADVLEAGVYWRHGGDGLNVGASVNGGWASLSSRRVLMVQSGTADATLYRKSEGHWNGAIASASFNVGYKVNFGRYYMKPELSADYVVLYEQGYTEHGGGAAFDLNVASRTSSEGVVQGDMVVGANYGDAIRWSPELTLGWRQVVTGGPADTTANFLGGQKFTLSSSFADKGGLLARLGLRASGNYADFSAGAGGVFRSGYDTYDARATARFLF
ncbi:MAG: autotransporter outer membrane beta-barrel domain-containing protein [Caulobacteraceae bacterium]|nr:autotransporter outer membrane beta-barrel domain-containing protein [Caulobacteraceae bacterium]